MISIVFDWLTSRADAIALFGGFLAFMIWGARRNSLEIAKLRLEIKSLTDETRIYRPSQAEIEDILTKSGKLPRHVSRISGSARALEEFSNKLPEFLLRLSAYYGHVQSRLAISKWRLAAAMSHEPDPFPGGGERHPDVGDIVSLWQMARDEAKKELDPDIIRAIDRFLARFSYAT